MSNNTVRKYVQELEERGSSSRSAPALSRGTGASKTEVCSTRSCRSSFPSTSFISGRWMLWTEQRNDSEWQDAWSGPACETGEYLSRRTVIMGNQNREAINAVRETATGSRSPAGLRRLGTATRMNASLSRRLSAFFGSTPDQAPKAAKFAVLIPGHAGFPKRVKRSEGRDTTPHPKRPPFRPVSRCVRSCWQRRVCTHFHPQKRMWAVLQAIATRAFLPCGTH